MFGGELTEIHSFISNDHWQHDVEDDHVRSLHHGHIVSFYAIGGREDAISLKFEIVLQATKHRRVVFDDQNGFTGHGC